MTLPDNGEKTRSSEEKPLAVVTGATKGIGLAIARLFLDRGCRVIGSYSRDDDAARSVLTDLRRHAGNLTLLKADAGALGTLDVIADAVARTGGRLRFLVLNAGMTDRTPFGDVSPHVWERVITTNLSMPFLLTQRLSPLLEDEKGRVVFIGSAMGIRPHSVSVPYGVSKAGLHFLAQSLAKELSPRSITVNAVAPGFIDTSWQSGKSPEMRKRIEGKICLRRFGTADEIADAVACVVEQPYVTGQIIGVDGGYDLA